MISVPFAQKCVQELLAGFPGEVISSYLAFAEKGDRERLDATVLGVLNFYLAEKPNAPLVDMPGNTRLVEDLGCDSLTMMDTVFMVEAVLDVKLDDAELSKLLTLDDLRDLLRRKIQATEAASI